jgi:dTDP-D-glucose 4,6-dehydratase
LGYEPKMEFEKGLQATIQWFNDHWVDIQRDAEFPPGMSAAAHGVVVKG